MTEFSPRQAETERLTVHVIWMTSGLGCDGDTVAMTAATQPSLEELLHRALPGMPGVALYNPMLAVETGDDFMQAWYDAEAGKLDPFILVLEGAVPNEQINGDGHWAALGVDPGTGQPITTNEWIDRLAPRAAVVLAVGTCATYGGIPAMKNNPTGAMGLRDHLRTALHDRARRAVRPAADDDGELRDVRSVRGGIRRPRRPAVPCAAERLSGMWAAAVARARG